MIALLRGIVAAIGRESLVLSATGVGYEITATPALLARLTPGERAQLWIETIVREDFIRLYGFRTAHERQVFRILMSVQGVGARHALSILQVLPASALADAIAAEDVTSICKAHGVGKKIAQRIVTELKTKLGDLAASDFRVGAAMTSEPGPEMPDNDESTAPAADPAETAPLTDTENGDDLRNDAISALVNLGYDRTQAHQAVAKRLQTADQDSLDVATLIRDALKTLSPA